MKKLKTKIKKNKKTILIFSILLIVIISLPAFFYVYFINRIYPNVYVANINLSGLTKSEAKTVLSSKLSKEENITLIYNNLTYSLPISSINPIYDLDKTTERAELLGRSGNIEFDLGQILGSFKKPTHYGLEYQIDENYLDNYISDLNKQISTPGTDPKLEYSKNIVTIERGKTGNQIDINKLKNDLIEKSFQSKKYSNTNRNG